MLRKATRALEHNQRRSEMQRKSIEIGDKFRIPVAKQARGFRRGFQASFSEREHTAVAILPGNKVRDEDGKLHKISLIKTTGRRAAVRQRLPPRS